METRSSAVRLAIISAPLLALCGMPPAAAQSVEPHDLRTGRILVAARNFPDPTFAESVILLTQYSEEGAMGFIINRQTTASVARAVPGANSSDPMYSGGPVSAPAVYGLLRSPVFPVQGSPATSNPNQANANQPNANQVKPAQARLVLGDIYMIMERDLLEKTVSSKVPADRFHAYLGYCGWGPGQLENEVKHGAWYIFNGRVEMVFDDEPDSLWGRLIGLTEHRIARAMPHR
jgi:putative transcriptional regulator